MFTHTILQRMKRLLTVVLLSVSCICVNTRDVHAWGIWAHNHINKAAIFALPPEMGKFFFNHADFIVQESTVPDLRKYTYKERSENCKHYINLEKYGHGKSSMPATLNDAIAQFGKDSVDRYGILPWHIQHMVDLLTEAFKNKRKTEILLVAADLGHYIGDAHVPLHTTSNHDGQLTGQRGIHAFWEAQLPELFGREYQLYTGDALYLKNTHKAAWEIIENTFSKADKLYASEMQMRNDNPKSKQYILGRDGEPIKNIFGQPVHAYNYAHVYHELLDGMVEEQIRLAIRYTADLWYTAWVNAGKPDLSTLDNQSLTTDNSDYYRYERHLWLTKGKVIGCNSEKEFPDLKKK